MTLQWQIGFGILIGALMLVILLLFLAAIGVGVAMVADHINHRRLLGLQRDYQKHQPPPAPEYDDEYE